GMAHRAASLVVDSRDKAYLLLVPCAVGHSGPARSCGVLRQNLDCAFTYGPLATETRARDAGPAPNAPRDGKPERFPRRGGRMSRTVAVLGATGLVGRTTVRVLESRAFPLGELRLLASERSAALTIPFR